MLYISHFVNNMYQHKRCLLLPSCAYAWCLDGCCFCWSSPLGSRIIFYFLQLKGSFSKEWGGYSPWMFGQLQWFSQNCWLTVTLVASKTMVAFTFTTPHPFDPKYLKREWKINCEKINWIGAGVSIWIWWDFWQSLLIIWKFNHSSSWIRNWTDSKFSYII